MKNFFQDFASAVDQTGGVLLLALPIVPLILLFGGLIKASRSSCDRLGNSRAIEIAKATLAKPRYPGDEFDRDIAQHIINMLG